MDPSGAKAAAVKPKGWLDPFEDGLMPPRELWIGPDDSVSHYFRWIWEYLAYLTLVADLRRDETVLELGCGHGRTGRALLDYLRPPGRYTGLDVDRTRIRDAQSRIETRWPNFTFVWADVRNRHYNPQGKTDAASYRFPFPDGSFDVIYAASLYTHLLPPETRNYLAETRRVLKPNGRCLFSFFLLDSYQGPGTTISPLYEFRSPYPGHPGVAVRDLQCPDDLIGYSRSVVTAYAGDAGLHVARTIPGLWSRNGAWAVHEQDLILLTAD